ncbi:MAG: SDR family oxidoreductase [Coriobacteriales bacterium]|jgi:NAD(P)-dependent dehydrogenase (short-subunit alcohol dehydrogenase family)|nr:SDR family oxidoreductase [Coriobacteriales bacterium]
MKDMLEGKVALITGATSGMGEATARLFAREGAKVVIGGRSADKGRRIAAEIEEAGGVARFYASLDVTEQDSVDAVVDATLREFGQIDILATYAGQTFDHDGLDPWEQYDRTMDANMTGTYRCVLAVLPHMKERESGNIIICSSNGAFNPTTPAYDYHMAKGACESLTVNLATELAPLGIRVNCIKPGPIVTPFWDELIEEGEGRRALFAGIAKREVPMERVGTPEDIAGPALFFASGLSAYVTGLCLYVAGGMGYIYAHGQSFLMSGEAGI